MIFDGRGRNESQRAELRQELGSYLGIDADHVGLFWKGRVALHAILRALGVGAGDEVILPAFTCVAVPNAIMYTGARPIYVDIDPGTYNIDPVRVEERITSRTRAVLAQNTFGLTADLGALREITSKAKVALIEDCAHGFGGTYADNPSGTFADASFFSCQWSKPLSSGLGGIAVAREDDLAHEIRRIESQSADPKQMDLLALRALILANDLLVNPRTYTLLQGMYRWLSRNGIVIGSSDEIEISGTRVPEGFERRMSGVQAARARRAVQGIATQVHRRRRIAAQYKILLARFGVAPPVEPDYARHSYLRYPLRVENRDRFTSSAKEQGLEVGDWFLSPVHPIVTGLERWGYRWGENPRAELISAQMVNLPTYHRVDRRYLTRLDAFLEAHQDDLVRDLQ